MSTVARPMIHRVAIRTPRRPRRSPIVEKMTLPTGLAAKATPYVANDAMSAAEPSSSRKKTVGKTVAANSPKIAKSKYSSAVPPVAARAARRSMLRVFFGTGGDGSTDMGTLISVIVGHSSAVRNAEGPDGPGGPRGGAGRASAPERHRTAAPAP